MDEQGRQRIEIDRPASKRGETDLRRPQSRRVEMVIIALIAAHSFAIGLALLLAPRFSLQLGGWEPGGVTFFVRQAGAFHLVVATGYLIEYFRHQTFVFLVMTKSIAVVFLLFTWIGGAAQWPVLVSALGDGVMILAAILLRSRHSRSSSGISDGE